MEERTIRGGKKGQQTAQKNRINEEITAQEVRLIDIEGEQAGIQSLQDAQTMADAAGAEPPVCRIMDYGKFIFEKSKELKEQKKKQKQIQIKEIKFRPGTDEGDYQVKLRNLRKFLEAGDKAKITIRFRGREMAHQEIGIELLNRIKADLEEIAVVESFPNRVEGRQMVMMMAPVAKK
ncbi:translation initiation factor IF-3 [Pseudoalteromonas sp. TB25]|uniref:translation initiation factor IF-3 n=1 Tax=Pseudoalteromonas sp. TB25 TaxID=985258 RepID=UPI000976BFC1|nr:translation initiation factor IF-3 [Pseudoalteromonas sp. TB25]